MSWPHDPDVKITFANIQKDLASFANQGTLNAAFPSKNKMDVTWRELQYTKKARFTIDRTNKVMVEYDRMKTDYHSFLSGPYMADLSYTATQMLALLPREDDYIEAQAFAIDSDNTSEKGDILSLVNKIIETPMMSNQDQIVESTQVIFLHGAAGSGKSVAVIETARKQADMYLAGNTNRIFFYIDAQARALARIDEAIAFETQNYRMPFIYSAVTALTRNGIVVPIIDGFDELIGSGGFADAFKSLSSFLSALEKNGSILATSRSTFFDNNVLNYIANQFSNNDSLNYQICTVRLDAWDSPTRDKYFNAYFQKNTTNSKKALGYYSKLNKYLTQRSLELLGKPFYCAQLANLIASEVNKQTDPHLRDFQNVDLLDYLISYYLDREKKKYLNRQDEIILDDDGHTKFLSQLSLELWWQETRAIDSDTLSAIADMIIDEKHIAPEDQPIFKGKINSHAFLRSDRSTEGAKLVFENSAYFDYFLLIALFEILEDDSELYLKQFLSRSMLGDTLLENIHYRSLSIDEEKVKLYLKKISLALSNAPSGGLARRNGGQIVCAMLSGREINVEIQNIEAYKASLAGFRTKGSKMENCYFNEINLLGTSLHEVNLKNTVFNKVIISDTTSFKGTKIVPMIDMNFLYIDGREMFDPESVSEEIKKHDGIVPEQLSIKPLNRRQREVIELLSAFGKKTKNRFLFDLDKNNEPQFASIMGDKNWTILQKILLESGVLEKKPKDRSGRQQYLFRLSAEVEKIIACVNDMSKNNSKNIELFSEAFWKL